MTGAEADTDTAPEKCAGEAVTEAGEEAEEEEAVEATEAGTQSTSH